MANFYKKSHQLGRSMIEMLGVLAIIGVLSIAGIAAYSQAMFKYQLTTHAEAFNLLLQRSIELLPTLQREYGRKTTGSNNVAQIMAEAEMLPDGMFYNPQTKQLYDVFKNIINISYNLSAHGDGGSSTDYYIQMVLDRNENKVTERARAICRNILSVAKESAGLGKDVVEVRSTGGAGGSAYLRGKTLREAGIAEIDSVCNSCDSSSRCTLLVYISSILH